MGNEAENKVTGCDEVNKELPLPSDKVMVQEMLRADEMTVEYVGRWHSPEADADDRTFKVRHGGREWDVVARYGDDQTSCPNIKIIIRKLFGTEVTPKLIAMVPNRRRARDNDDMLIYAAMTAALHSGRWLEFVKALSEAGGE